MSEYVKRGDVVRILQSGRQDLISIVQSGLQSGQYIALEDDDPRLAVGVETDTGDGKQ